MRGRQFQKILDSIGSDTVDAILQVGVGYGEELPLIRKAFPAAKLIGFEPCSGFIDHWKRKGYPGLFLPYAIASEPGVRKLYPRSGKYEATSMFPRENEAKVELVQAVTLDMMLSFWGPLGRSVFLWMDCESAELEAINGGKKFLQHVKYVLAEAVSGESSRGQRIGAPEPGAVQQALVESGFSFISQVGRSDILLKSSRPNLP